MPDTVRSRRPARPETAMPLVVLTVLGALVVLTSGLLSGLAASTGFLVGCAAWAVGCLRLRRRLAHAADLPDESLDEREIAARDRSYLHAYQALGGAVTVLLLLALADEPAFADGELVESWTYLLFAVLLLSLALPSVVLAIRSPAGEH